MFTISQDFQGKAHYSPVDFRLRVVPFGSVFRRWFCGGRPCCTSNHFTQSKSPNRCDPSNCVPSSEPRLRSAYGRTDAVPSIDLRCERRQKLQVGGDFGKVKTTRRSGSWTGDYRLSFRGQFVEELSDCSAPLAPSLTGGATRGINNPVMDALPKSDR